MLKKTMLLLMLFMGISVLTFAQKDPKAKSVLDGVSQKYKSLKGLKAAFEFSYTNSKDGSNTTQSGEIAVKGNKYHLKLPDQEIFNNGKIVWTYIVSDTYKEVTINYAGEVEDELTPSSVYTIYQKGYNYRLLGEKNEAGKTVQEVELTAESPGAAFTKVNLYVDKNNKDLIGWKLFDNQGGTFHYRFKSVNTNVDLPDETFVFNPQKYGKVEIIDLR
jgi:outer membrane lipoprotein-sorting protein